MIKHRNPHRAAAEAFLLAGHTRAELCQTFPMVPRYTLDKWFRLFATDEVKAAAKPRPPMRLDERKAALKLFAQGQMPADLRRLMPTIPNTTIGNWWRMHKAGPEYARLVSLGHYQRQTFEGGRTILNHHLQKENAKGRNLRIGSMTETLFKLETKEAQWLVKQLRNEQSVADYLATIIKRMRSISEGKTNA